MTHKPYRTPGVKPIEKRVFGRTVSTKVTALPIFIGYTQRGPSTEDETVTPSKTVKSDKDASEELKETPNSTKINAVRINSFGEFTDEFGGGDYTRTSKKKFFLFESIKLFFANGGLTCYIVSVGNYTGGKVSIEELMKGVDKIFEIPQANLVLAPDAASLTGTERGKFYNDLLLNCSF